MINLPVDTSTCSRPLIFASESGTTSSPLLILRRAFKISEKTVPADTLSQAAVCTLRIIREWFWGKRYKRTIHNWTGSTECSLSGHKLMFNSSSTYLSHPWPSFSGLKSSTFSSSSTSTLIIGLGQTWKAGFPWIQTSCDRRRGCWSCNAMHQIRIET